ncbi:succinyldiaminopimelate transaminase [Piscicoccus intestinalis]|uniref:succinyldiaminopimelate transaminase n=1 Tax=Piscicoccus intestinalis TaxID=746033 RepID=UPI0008385584|nr:succinyldiaminopimelate transaminase [Piscicoccus intestinalis]
MNTGTAGSGAARLALPDFPWDLLAPHKATAAAHHDGIVDLSVGTPVDPTPDVVRDALAAASDSPGYPQTWGTPQLREAVSRWFARRRAVPGLDPDAVLPTIGSKELVAWLPTLLGLGPGDIVGLPAVAYPTYVVGARLAGATPQEVEGLAQFGPPTPATTPKLLWINSPCNPTGRVLGVDHLRKVVAWARSNGMIVASDECYAQLDWRPEADRGAGESGTPSVLDPRVCDGDHSGLLCVYSLSKQSNLAGYRAAFVAGDASLIAGLLEVRKHAGMIMPRPVQQAMIAALDDDASVDAQKERYRRRRDVLVPAVRAAGWTVDHSDAGLYLWATRGTDAWSDVEELSRAGILVAPGTFYGPGGRNHVRIALTAPDDRIDAAAQRLTSI